MGIQLAIGRYWAANMQLLLGANINWPGFSYSDAEKRVIETTASTLKPGEYRTFLIFNTFLFLILAFLLMWFGFVGLLTQLYPHFQDAQASVFFFLLGFFCLVGLSIGLPVTMAVSALLTGVFYKHPPLEQPSAKELSALTNKALFQISRMALILTLISMIGAFFMPPTENRAFKIFLVIVKFGVTTATLIAYYFSKRSLEKQK